MGRTHHQIIADVLNVCGVDAFTISIICRKANMPGDEAKILIKMLVERQMLIKSQNENKNITYKTTDNGFKFLESMDVLDKLINTELRYDN